MIKVNDSFVPAFAADDNENLSNSPFLGEAVLDEYLIDAAHQVEDEPVTSESPFAHAFEAELVDAGIEDELSEILDTSYDLYTEDESGGDVDDEESEDFAGDEEFDSPADLYLTNEDTEELEEELDAEFGLPGSEEAKADEWDEGEQEDEEFEDEDVEDEAFEDELRDQLLEDDEIEHEEDDAFLHNLEDHLVEEYLAEQEQEEEAEASNSVTFPSGKSLPIVVGPIGKGQEHYDPNNSGNPLLDTSARHRATRLSKNFTVGELARSGSKRFDIARIDPKLVQCLQAIRDAVGKPVRVTSGYRSYGHNRRVYRKRKKKPTRSQHISGRAADIKVRGMTGLELAKVAIDACGCNIGVGIGTSYAHIDVRGKWAKWTYFKDRKAKARALKSVMDHHRQCKGKIRTRSQPPPPDVSMGPTIAPRGEPKVPAGFKIVKRKGVSRGLSRYGGGRLDQTLLRLRYENNLKVTDDEIDTFQRIANIETGGRLQAINTWDSAVISIGFMQFTLQHGKVQKWIRMAEAPFRKYGIILDHQNTYLWITKKKKENRQTAIAGAPNESELRWNGWAERFYEAGLDEKIVAAEVSLAREFLKRYLRGLRKKLRKRGMGKKKYEMFKAYYDASPVVRGIFQASYNNLPSTSAKAVYIVMRDVRSSHDPEPRRFLELYKRAVRKSFSDKGLASRGKHLTSKTLKGAQFD